MLNSLLHYLLDIALDIVLIYLLQQIIGEISMSLQTERELRLLREADTEQEEPPGGGGDADADDGTDEEEQQFDISLAATHSYMGGGLVAVRGRCVLEAGWEGPVPAVAHHGCVFPGETVPMLLPNAHDAALLAHAIRHNKLFGLLCPDESGTIVSGYGVLCEVFEVCEQAEGGQRQEQGEGEGEEDREDQEIPAPAAAGRSPALSFKARANHRFRLLEMPKSPMPIHLYARMRTVCVRVLPEVRLGDPLYPSRLASLDPLRHSRTPLDRRLRRMDAATTPWPLFVFNIFDYTRMRDIIREYFKTLMFENLPEEPVSLSFWVASNLALCARDRLALFAVDNVLLRLHMEVRFIARFQKSVLCCSSCLNEIARREHIFAMSSEGLHSNYTNLGGYMHDIVTVSRAVNTVPSGAAVAEYSWFPGYTWTIALCRRCMAHLGWRFRAQKRNLRPQQFYGLCRNYVQPRYEPELDLDQPNTGGVDLDQTNNDNNTPPDTPDIQAD